MSTITRSKSIVIFTYFLMLLKLSSVNYPPIALWSYVYFTTRLSFLGIIWHRLHTIQWRYHRLSDRPITRL